MKKKYGFAFTWESVLVLLFLLISLSSGFYSGSHLVSNYRTTRIENECVAIDRALEMYAQSHSVVLSDTVKLVTARDKLIYESTRNYPKDLYELGIIQLEAGYFTTKIDLSQYSYTTKTASNGKMTYELGVNLPNGVYYKSPRSNM